LEPQHVCSLGEGLIVLNERIYGFLYLRGIDLAKEGFQKVELYLPKLRDRYKLPFNLAKALNLGNSKKVVLLPELFYRLL
jgi:hypothetical protein